MPTQRLSKGDKVDNEPTRNQQTPNKDDELQRSNTSFRVVSMERQEHHRLSEVLPGTITVGMVLDELKKKRAKRDSAVGTRFCRNG